MPFTNRHSIAAVLAASMLAGCEARDMASNVDDELESSADALSAGNGLTLNGIMNNGIMNNGIMNNGLGASVLATSFATWFSSDPVNADMLMSYGVRCALGPSSTITYYDPVGRKTYSWTGRLGLAPGWNAAAPTPYDQQIVSACLAALVNKYGQHVPVSLQGRTSAGASVPLEAGELTTYSFREGCFFGDVSAGALFAGLDHGAVAASASSLRACALDVTANGTYGACPPIFQVGACATYCTRSADGNSYTTCTYGGKTYPAVTTRIQPSLLVSCGDHVCQVSEKCGTSNSAKACSDCGACK